jgi:hypothetical protein
MNLRLVFSAFVSRQRSWWWSTKVSVFFFMVCIVTCFDTEDAVQIVSSFYYNLTSRNYTYLLHYYTFTHLTILTRQYSIIPLRSVWHSLRDCRLLTAICLSRSSCLQDNLSARTPRKTIAPLLRVRLLSCCIAMVTARTHRISVT